MIIIIFFFLAPSSLRMSNNFYRNLILGVHDSYWTHACDVDQMNKILREKFVELYDTPILENVSFSNHSAQFNSCPFMRRSMLYLSIPSFYTFMLLFIGLERILCDGNGWSIMWKTLKYHFPVNQEMRNPAILV